MTAPRAWVRDLDGTGSLHICANDDPGAIPLYSRTAIKEAVAAERAACAHDCEGNEFIGESIGPLMNVGWCMAIKSCAAAIRARKD